MVVVEGVAKVGEESRWGEGEGGNCTLYHRGYMEQSRAKVLASITKLL